jgi:hypothetical protein
MVDHWSLVVALGAVIALALVLRWAFGRGRSLVQRRPEAGHPWEYGLLESVAAPATYDEGEAIRRRLQAAGIRSNLVVTEDGPRIFVFPDDAARARALLR